MGKEKVIGALIFIFAFLILIYYTWGLVLLQNPLTGPALEAWINDLFPTSGADNIWNALFKPDPMFLIILPVWLGALLICIIAMWIGWTMLTTPAPEPLEDFDFDEEEVAEAKPEEESTE
jgi:hypothetical protein